MDKWQTQYAFWASFGWPAYEENVAFTDGQEPEYPHITYQAMGGVMGQPLIVSASLWARDNSWRTIDKKADEILRYIADEGSVVLPLDGGGYFWIKIPETTPFSQHMAAGSDDADIKRAYITVDAECLTRV